MLLVIDVGNTNTVIGALDGDRVVRRWRVSTAPRTTDEFGLLLLQLLGHRGMKPADLHGVVVSCVVPSVLYAIEKATRRYLDLDSMVVGRGLKTGMRVRTDNPGRWAPTGSSTRWRPSRCTRCRSWWWTSDGDHLRLRRPQRRLRRRRHLAGLRDLGGRPVPAHRQLPKVELDRTRSVIGQNTVASMQAGSSGATSASWTAGAALPRGARRRRRARPRPPAGRVVHRHGRAGQRHRERVQPDQRGRRRADPPGHAAALRAEPTPQLSPRRVRGGQRSAGEGRGPPATSDPRG